MADCDSVGAEFESRTTLHKLKIVERILDNRRVAGMADAVASKAIVLHWACGFKSHLGDQEIMTLFNRWPKLQKLFSMVGTRYYGDGGTIHTSNYVDVETNHGVVVGVWFRCQLLPFKQMLVDGDRAIEVAHLYENHKFELHGVEIKDIK